MTAHHLLLSSQLAFAALALGPSVAVAQQAREAAPLAHERYSLANGLEVILAPDRSAPQVVVDIWYRVGSKDERRDRTGFAHLFEHLMFMGTERAPNFDVIMEEAGGANNASTSSDRTNYFDWGPSSMLPTLLWLEADRLERLDQDMTQDKLEAQRGVVLNEYRQNYENRPYAKAELAMSQLLYPPQHPYHIGTIGLPEHIEAATLEDVIGFFQTFYVPNNASLVVAGDFDPEAVKPLVESLFGSLPRGDDPPRQEIPVITLDKTVRRTLVDAVRLPMLQMAWHSPAFYQRGDAEMDILAGLLGDAPNGRLYRRLVVEDELAADVSCYQASAYLSSTFQIHVVALPGADLAKIEAAVDSVLREVTAGAIGDQELAPYRSAYELRLLRPVDSLRERADLLNQYAFYFGEPDSLERDLARYRGVTPDTLRSMASGVFGANGRGIVTVLPANEPLAANPRDQRPPDLASSDLALDGQVESLGSGLELCYFERPNAPFTALRVFFPFGSGLDGPGREGAVALLFDLLDEGVVLADGTELSAAQFADRLRRLGATLDLRVSDDSTVVSLEVLHANAGPALELLESALLRPKLDAAELKRLRGQRLEDLRSESDDPARVAGRVQRAAWFGAEHPFGHPADGSIAGLESTTLEELRALHGHLLLQGQAKLFCVGPWPLADARELLGQGLANLASRRGAARRAELPGLVAHQAGLRIVFCDAPGTTQTQVRFLASAPEPASAERLDVELLSVVLGGTFSSRLNMNLREDKHWTYGASARYAPWAGGAYVQAGASVQVDRSGAAIDEFLKEFERLALQGISEFEDEKARSSLRQRVVQGAASVGGLCDVAATQARLGLSLEVLNSYLGATRSPRLAALNAMAPRAFQPELLILVGDRAQVWPQLEALAQAGRIDLSRLIEVDAQGLPLAP